MNLEKEIVQSIIDFAEKFDVEKVILFGSRARGDNRARSDIDIAVQGGNFIDFHEAMDEETPTLLEFDVANLSDKLNENFLAEIKRDGVILYEKI